MSDRIYAFEENKIQNFRSRKQTQADLETLTHRLNLDFSGPAGEFVELLEDLIIGCHLTIEWYQKKIEKLAWMKRLYFFISLALLALIPIIVFWISGKGSGSASIMASQITIVLTGLIGFQRGISAWLDDRKVLAAYVRAASDLKKEYYGFEQRWENRTVEEESKDEFEANLLSVISRAREICDQEQSTYFQNLSYPSLEVSKILSSASANATALTGKFSHPSLLRQKAEQEAQQNSIRADALVAHFKALLDELETELEQQRNSGATEEELALLNQGIQSVIKKLRSSEIDAATARATLQSSLV